MGVRRQRLWDQIGDLSNGAFSPIVSPGKVKMSQKSSAPPGRVPAEKLACDIRHATRRHHSAEDKIRIVLEGAIGT